METWAIILSVIIPLLLFMWAMLPWIKHVIKSEISPLTERIARIEGRLDTFMEQQKLFIDAYEKMGKMKNPGNEETRLLTRLREGIITDDEAIRLREIMNNRRQQAEESNDFLKAILIIGILGLIAYALSRNR